jgi:AcrR family transcriptional regulator
MKAAVQRKKAPSPGRTRNDPRSDRTRAAILRRAVDLASTEGLEGLTIGRLAEDLKMSKSGLFAHFGSKEELQLATVDAAKQIFVEKIMEPAFQNAPGMPRLWALCDLWLSHVEHKVFAGGCFFTAASFEFDSRKGPVRDRIAGIMSHWLQALARTVTEAQQAGHLDPAIEPSSLAFEINSLAMGGHWANQILDDKGAHARVRKTILAKLRAMATKRCPKLPA